MMTFIILLVVIIVSFIIYAGIKDDSAGKNDKELLLLGRYVGGCKEIYDSGLTGWMKVKKDMIEIKYAQKSEGYVYIIPIENVLEAYLQSEEDIQKQVTLGRLLVFGILAFSSGLKKKTKEMKKYMVIKFLNKNGEEETIIYDSNRYFDALEKINYFKNNYEENLKNKIVK